MRIVLYDYLIKRNVCDAFTRLKSVCQAMDDIPDIKYDSNNTVVWYFAFHYEDKKTRKKCPRSVCCVNDYFNASHCQFIILFVVYITFLSLLQNDFYDNEIIFQELKFLCYWYKDQINCVIFLWIPSKYYYITIDNNYL